MQYKKRYKTYYTHNNAYFNLNKLSEEYIFDSSNMRFTYGKSIAITKSGKYLLITYISGIREGGGFSYWVSYPGYPSITNSPINTYKSKGCLADSAGVTTFSFILDIRDENGATFTQNYYPGSTGAAQTGWINQLIKLEDY